MERFYAIKKQEASIVQRLGSDKHPSFCGGPHESPNAGIAKPSLHNKDRVILTVRHPNKVRVEIKISNS
ncbi:unnamed protein product [Caenorhabditis brenneri]